MLSFFRRAGKSKAGTWIVALLMAGGLAGFAISDIQNFGSGNIGFGMGGSSLVKVGDQIVTDKEMSQAMERRLQQARQQQPNADYATIMADFDPILAALVDQQTLIAFADKYGFPMSKRLIDAEIAQIPAAKGLNGQFSQQAYDRFLAEQHLTDPEVRQIIAGELLQRLLLVPLASNPRVPVGIASPYASMLLEAREGKAVIIPVDAFRAGLKPSESELQRFYADNRARYVVPEQRELRIARIGPQQVAGIAASDQEIAAEYNKNKAAYAPKDKRTLTQVVVADQAAANAIAAKAKSGVALAQAAGANAAVTTVADQTLEAYSGVAGDKASAAVFAAPQGAIVGPFQSEFGWIVAKVDSISTQSGKSLDQARGEIAAKLNVEKRKDAIETLVDKVQSAVDDGSNFTEAAAKANLQVTTTPLITAAGASRSDPSYKAPPELAPVIKTGFDIAPNDPPEILNLADDQGYAMVSPAQIVPAAPAPLADIHDRVVNDWITTQATQRARAAATAIADKAGRGIPLDQAAREAGTALPPVRPLAARRIQIATSQGTVPAPLRLLFSLAQGKSKMVDVPEAHAFFVIKVDKVVPGNALLQPALISQMQTELREPTSQEYAQEFVAAIRSQMKVKRNDSAIQAMQARLKSGGS